MKAIQACNNMDSVSIAGVWRCSGGVAGEEKICWHNASLRHGASRRLAQRQARGAGSPANSAKRRLATWRNLALFPPPRTHYAHRTVPSPQQAGACAAFSEQVFKTRKTGGSLLDAPHAARLFLYGRWACFSTCALAWLRQSTAHCISSHTRCTFGGGFRALALPAARAGIWLWRIWHRNGARIARHARAYPRSLPISWVEGVRRED